jgi:cell division protein ZapA
VQVTIGGETYTVRSEAPPEYTQDVAAYVASAIDRIRALAPSLESHRAAVLAALSITDELFQARRGDADVAARLQALAADVAPLLPPVKRGRGAKVAHTD